MKMNKIYEILGSTYAALCEVSEIEDLWQMMYAEAQETARLLAEENRRLKEELKKYEEQSI